MPLGPEKKPPMHVIKSSYLAILDPGASWLQYSAAHQSLAVTDKALQHRHLLSKLLSPLPLALIKKEIGLEMQLSGRVLA